MNRAAFAVAIMWAAMWGTALGGTIGTTVRFTTSSGQFDVGLYSDPDVLTTVQNFLAYVNSGAYTNSIIHRSTTYDPSQIQVIQGGGFFLQTTSTSNVILPIATNPPIALQATHPNLAGTIAMARQTEPDTATSQWFFNVTDNRGLDGSYAVFGEVLGGGMSVVNAIAALDVYDAAPNLGPAFGEMPLYGPELLTPNLVMVGGVAVVPEPSTLMLAAVGIAAVCVAHRRRQGRMSPA